jgi:hypothetical protein
MEHTQELKKAYKKSLIIYIAFMISLVVYLVFFEILRVHVSDFEGAMERIDFPWLRYAFYALGFVQVFLIKFIRETAIKSTSARETQILIQNLQRSSVISASLCEVPALLGWVLFFLSGGSQDFYILLIMSFVLFIIYFPRFTDWDMWIRSKTNHR